MSATAGSTRRDRGAADALSLVLIAPAAIGLALLVVSLGRSVESRSQAQSAAESAAQAAALERTFGAAQSAATQVANAMLGDVATCNRPLVSVSSPATFRPGGTVSVTVECATSNAGVEVVQPSVRRHRATAVATIDQFRAAGGP